jgi:hypothetical protein
VPSKNKLIFGAVIIAAVFVLQNLAKKKTDGIAAKIVGLGA